MKIVDAWLLRPAYKNTVDAVPTSEDSVDSC